MLHTVVPLGVEDLPACLDLAEDRDWAREEGKWRLLLELADVYGIRDDAGALVGTATLTRHADVSAGVGMVLVARRHAGQGLGRRLMEHVVAAAGDALVFLNATEFGRPLYEKLGFVTVGATHILKGAYAGTAAALGRRATAADLPGIIALDRRVTGADRTPLITRLPAFADHIRVIEEGGVITGYATAWPNLDVHQISPVVAVDEQQARALVHGLAVLTPGRIRVDVETGFPGLRGWLAESGLTEIVATRVMTMGGRPLPGDRGRYAVAFNQAVG